MTQAPLIIAHRGSSGVYPENTLRAFVAAAAAGADMCELDVRLSRDGALVVIHDATVDRTTDGRGAVATMVLAELKSLDAGVKHGAAFAGERIPTLDEVFDALGGRCGINIELKAERTEKLVCETIRQRSAYETAMVSSFDWPALRRVRAVNPAIRTGLLGEKRANRLTKEASAIGAWSVNPRFDLADPELCAKAHRHGLKVLVWTVDAPELMRLMIQNGADGIMTNYPERLREVAGG